MAGWAVVGGCGCEGGAVDEPSAISFYIPAQGRPIYKQFAMDDSTGKHLERRPNSIVSTECAASIPLTFYILMFLFQGTYIRDTWCLGCFAEMDIAL